MHMYLESTHSLSSSSSAAAGTVTVNGGAMDPNKFEGNSVFYKVYQQIDVMKKFKLTSEMEKKEKVCLE
jgi:opacity protein-like surface antigen